MKFYHSDVANGPVLNGAVGSLAELLDAVLVDGYGLKSTTGATIASGVCTLTVTGGHAADVLMTVLVAGATGSFTGLNGEHVVTAKGANTVSFATALTGTPTGTITFKVAPLGWTRAFTGTGKRAFKSGSLLSTGCFLRVSDTATGSADVRVVGYENMTDVDTGTKPFPTDAQMSGGLYWPKSDSSDSSARGWDIWGDDRLFYIKLRAPATSYAPGPIFYFGDPISFKPGDAYGCVISGHRANTAGGIAASYQVGSIGYNQSTSVAENGYIARGASGASGAVPYTHQALFGYNSGFSGSAGAMYRAFAFPNAVDSGLFVGPVHLMLDSGVRGKMPGALHTPQNAVASFANKAQIAGSGEYAGRVLEATAVGTTSGGEAGVMFFDLTGPWR